MNQNVNLDLIPKFAVFGNLYFSQYDVGRTATINLLNGAEAYTIPVGATVKIQATKPSGLGFNETCTFSGNVVTVVSTETMTDEAGRIPCELRIEYNGDVLGTANFTFNVERSPHPEGTTDGTAESVISQITVAFESAMTQIENSGGLTNDIKEALLNCFQKVAWIDDDGQDYYDALEEALYNVEVTGITLNSNSLLFNELNQTSQLTATLIPSTATNPISWLSSDNSVCTVVNGLVTSVGYGNATITASAGSVSATCSVSIVETTVVSLNAVLSGGTFYVGDPVDSIKPYLTVTANWSDSTSSTVPSGSYTLSGSLSNIGANTITVSYGGQTTTVTVNAISVELVSISAVYTQSGTVYDTDTLDSLKSDLVVTATYSDSSTATVPSADYTLSGTLTVGTSTITVSYGGKTDAFNVAVSNAPLIPSDYQQVEWVGFDGNSRIVTDQTNDTNDFKFEAEVHVNQVSSGSETIACVASSASSIIEFGVDNNANPLYMYHTGYTRLQNVQGIYTDSIFLSVERSTTGNTEILKGIINGIEYSNSRSFMSIASGLKYVIGSAGYGQQRYGYTGKVLSASYYSGATKTVDLIPCYRKNDGVIGFYDIIGNKFYINSGSGTFTKGADV